MTLSSRHRIRNSSPGGLRPSTLPLGHEAPHNTDFHTWMGKKHFCFFQTAETGNRTPNSGVKGSGANHYPRAPAPCVWILYTWHDDTSRYIIAIYSIFEFYNNYKSAMRLHFFVVILKWLGSLLRFELNMCIYWAHHVLKNIMCFLNNKIDILPIAGSL